MDPGAKAMVVIVGAGAVGSVVWFAVRRAVRFLAREERESEIEDELVANNDTYEAAHGDSESDQP